MKPAATVVALLLVLAVFGLPTCQAANESHASDTAADVLQPAAPIGDDYAGPQAHNTCTNWSPTSAPTAVLVQCPRTGPKHTRVQGVYNQLWLLAYMLAAGLTYACCLLINKQLKLATWQQRLLFSTQDAGQYQTKAAAGDGGCAKASTCTSGGNHVHAEHHAGVNVQVNRCPFGHGSVGAGPYPGYVHGKHPAVCANGCIPDPQLGKYGHSLETPQQTLIREALEFQDLFHKDTQRPPGAKDTRVQQILADIESTGTYTHTFDELQHGARVAWRNAPKCSNRKFWEELRLIDGRDASTPSEMFDVCLELLEKAGMSCATTANIAVFRPQTPGSSDGPRIWNNQLIRYAGYRQPGGAKVLGDPAEADFTQMLQDDFGWKPSGALGRFDILPLLLQANSDEAPQLFEIPKQYVGGGHNVSQGCCSQLSGKFQ